MEPKDAKHVDSLVNLNPQFHSKRFILEQYSRTSPDHFSIVILPSAMAGRSGVVARPVCQALYKYSYATWICIFRYHPLQISGGPQHGPWPAKKCRKVPEFLEIGKNLHPRWCRFLFTTSTSFFEQTFQLLLQSDVRRSTKKDPSFLLRCPSELIHAQLHCRLCK